MKTLLPFLARATGRPEGTVAEYVRQLRLAELIEGKDAKGRLAQPTTTADAARVLLALLSGERPASGPEDLRRSLGLVDTDGHYLVRVLELYLDEIVEHGRIAGITAMRLVVSRPWPGAIVTFGYEDGATAPRVFHHEDAKKTGFPQRDKRQLQVLQQRWRYKPGMTVWAAIELPTLMHAGLALGGRLDEAERHAPRGEVACLWN